ncbi:hypothetical protein Enr13x_62360 [Stieleria neptunia]|uniref:Uncharacterized protein n=1 Tax=Stieleria neptunia TaxID=2527979 RepID=A0A518HZY5_9BACT|nr:hypothetical protein Enr13x_62360 [Stieleria neptunia]
MAVCSQAGAWEQGRSGVSILLATLDGFAGDLLRREPPWQCVLRREPGNKIAVG